MNIPKIPATATGIIAVIITAGLAYYFIFIKKSKEEMAALAALDEEKAKIAAAVAAGVPSNTRTWDNYVYQKYADNLYKAMDGVGTDNLAVSKVFEHILTDVDFQCLEVAYGVRDGYNMTSRLRDDLSEYWINQINNMLKKNKVTFTI
jgi:hypothetical protein